MSVAAKAVPDYGRLPEFVRAHGWPAGLEEFVAGDRSQAPNVTLDIRLRHMGWKGLLSWRERNSALVFDGGCGTAPIAMSRHFNHVQAVYSDLTMLEAVDARLRHRGVTNVHLSSAMPAGRFDAVVVYGLAAAELTPDFLAAARCRLHDHGTVYIAFAAERATSMPRAVRTEFHTVIRNVRDVFASAESYWYLGTLTNGSELRIMGGKQRRFRYRIGAIASAWRGAHYGIRAGGETAAPALVEDVIERIATRTAAGSLSMERYVFAHPAGVTMIVRNDVTRTRMVVRIPFGAEALARARVNANCLEHLRTLAMAPVETPRLLLMDSVYGQPFFVESMLGGSPPRLTKLSVYETVLNEAAAFLIRFNLSTVVNIEFTPSVIERFIEPVVTAGIERLRRQQGGEILPELRTFLLRAFRGRSLNMVTTHGDFTTDNLLFDKAGRLNGAYDWDLSEAAGLPLTDLAYLFATSARAHTPGTKHGFRPGILRQLSPLESRLLARYGEALNIPPDLVTPLFLMSWLHHVGVRDSIAEPYLINADFWTDVLTCLPDIVRSHRAGAA